MYAPLTKGEVDFARRDTRITRMMKSESGNKSLKTLSQHRLPRNLGMMYFNAKLKLYWADKNLDPDRFEVREVFIILRGIVEDWISDSPARRQRERREARRAKDA